MMSPNNLTAKCGKLEVFVKEEEEADHPENLLIKQEKDIEESECEVAIKQEPLLWDEHEQVNDVKCLQTKMVAQKYAGLPGIVHDQPDVYETVDWPESEQDDDSMESLETSNAVEVLHISALDAYAKFADKVLDARRVDFSHINSWKPRTGYQARHVEWDMADSNVKDETIMQRYNRLMGEVTSLQQDILQHTEKGSVDISFDGSGNDEPTGSIQTSTVSAVQLERHVEQLHSQLLNLQLEKQLGVAVVEDIDNPHLASHKRLTALIDTLKHVKNKSARECSSSAPTLAGSPASGRSLGTGVTYQLFYSPEVVKLNQLGQAMQLEKRIERLEKLFGNDQEKLRRLFQWTCEGNVLSAVTALGKRLSLLEPARLDHIEGRLHAVYKKMNVIAEKAEAFPDKQPKVHKLHELMQKCDTLCSALPKVVERLVALQGLHTEAGQFGRTLHQLDVAQTQLASSLSNNKQLLKSVNDNFADNLSIINNNISSLDARIDAIDKQK